MKFNKILSSTIIVTCGSERGTAFFISPQKLLTAHHVVADFLYNEPITIKVEGREISCKMELVKENIDLALLTCEGYEHLDFLELLALPLQSQLHFSFFGYPDSIIGQYTGLDVKIKINHNYHGLKGDFDAYAVLDDDKSLSIFNGFSGSPVFDETEEVLGVVTQKLDGHIGFVSIKFVEDELKAKDLVLDTNIILHDNSPYGYLKNEKINKKTINQAGSRYDEEVHTSNTEVDNIFENLWNLEKVNQYKKDVVSFKDKFDILCTQISYNIPKYNSSEDIFQKKSHSYLRIYETFSQNDFKTIARQQANDEFRFLNNMLDEFRQKYSEAIKVPASNIWYFTGKAGVGKTHYMCNIASKLLTKTRVYMCFGSQFNLETEPVTQLLKLFDFESYNYLEELNAEAFEKKIRYIIIIDGLNEGVGEVYWKSYLNYLISRIKILNNLGLVLTVRTPFENKIGLSEIDNINNYTIEGFENIQLAKEKYFKKYNIIDDNLPTWIFRNPLFLRIYCQLYNSIPYYEKDNMKSLSFLYLNYVVMRGHEVSTTVDEDEQLHIACKYLLRLAHVSVFNKKCENITRVKAYSISKQIASNRTWSKSLLKGMLDTNLLMANWNENSDQDFVMFEYEQMEDYFRAIAFIKTKSDRKSKIDQIIDLQRWGSLHPEQEVKIHNFIVAISAIWPEMYNEEIISNTHFCTKELVKLYLESIPFHKDKVPEQIIMDFWNSNEFNIGYEYLINAFSSMNYDLFVPIHEKLKNMTLSERDLKWSTVVNNQYDYDKISNLLSEWAYIEYFKNKDCLNDQKHYVMVLSWMLSSSYPLLRGIIKRILFKAFKQKLSLIPDILLEFHNVNDPYIQEGLYCSIYGTVLISYDKEYITTISQLVYDYNFNNNNIICDVTVREWLLKIIDRARYITGSELFNKVLPPYSSTIVIPETTIISDDFFGFSDGSNSLAKSLLKFSDFNRYIIGTNSSNVSYTFTLNPIELAVTKINYLSFAIMLKMIANQIKEFGWNDELGIYDNNKYSYNRMHNERERIGKKYQWLALYNIIAKLTDNYKMCNSWSSHTDPEVYSINYPWLTGYHSYFDVTLPMSTPNYDLSFLDLNPFENKDYSHIDNLEWLKSKEYQPELIHFKQGGDSEWILLSTIYTLQNEEDKYPKKDLFIRYDSFFVKNSQLCEFEQWAKKQSFIGRWMPEYHDTINHLLFEYPWSKSMHVHMDDKWEYPDHGCPCPVMVSTYSHLQEDVQGASPSSLGSQLLPCIDLMELLQLKLIDMRHIVYDTENTPAAFDNHSDEYGIQGLFIRKDLLDKFLQENDYTLVYSIVGEKRIMDPMLSIPGFAYSACAKYTESKIISISDVKEELW